MSHRGLSGLLRDRSCEPRRRFGDSGAAGSRGIQLRRLAWTGAGEAVLLRPLPAARPRGNLQHFGLLPGHDQQLGALLDQMQRWADASGRKDPPVHYEGSGQFPKEGLFDCETQWKVRCTWADGLALDFMDTRTYHDLPDVPQPVINPPRPGWRTAWSSWARRAGCS